MLLILCLALTSPADWCGLHPARAGVPCVYADGEASVTDGMVELRGRDGQARRFSPSSCALYREGRPWEEIPIGDGSAFRGRTVRAGLGDGSVTWLAILRRGP